MKVFKEEKLIDLAVFQRFPQLNTRRLILRQGVDSDAAAVFEFKSKATLTENYAQEPHRQVPDSQRWLERARNSFDGQEDFFWVMELKENQRVIGCVTLWNLQKTDACAELGYEMHPVFEGKGFMSEAVQEVLSFGFDLLGLQRVEALPLARNHSSRQLLERIGFDLEGIMRQKICFHGEYLDQCIYSLLKPQWQKVGEKNESLKNEDHSHAIY